MSWLLCLLGVVCRIRSRIVLKSIIGARSVSVWVLTVHIALTIPQAFAEVYAALSELFWIRTLYHELAPVSQLRSTLHKKQAGEDIQLGVGRRGCRAVLRPAWLQKHRAYSYREGAASTALELEIIAIDYSQSTDICRQPGLLQSCRDLKAQHRARAGPVVCQSANTSAPEPGTSPCICKRCCLAE